MIKWFFAGLLLATAAHAEAPKFEEVFSLVRSNLIGVSESDLNKAAAQGFVEKLKGKVELRESEAAKSGSLISRTNLFEDSFAYVRVERVASGLGGQLTDAIKSHKKVKGVILDLRFAKGDDYNGAVEAVNTFLGEEKPVLKWGEHLGKTTARSEIIDAPLAVLINGQTIGAAEALAAAVRDHKLAVIIGGPTAGQAWVFDLFPLSNGQQLKIARGEVKLPNNEPITGKLAPDIELTVNEANERLWFEDPYKMIANPANPVGPAPFLTSVTNRPSRRPNSAEIARRHRESVEEERPESVRAALPAPQVVHDPALARAIDSLKGLAVLRSREAGAK